jgi:excisionase family DNA binding protein
MTAGITEVPADRWLDVKAATQRLGGISSRTVRRLLADHEITHYVIRGQYRIRVEDLESFITKARRSAL